MSTEASSPISPEEAHAILSQCTYELTMIRNAVDAQDVEYFAGFEDGQGALGNVLLYLFLPPGGFDELISTVGIADRGTLSFPEILALEKNCGCVYLTITAEDANTELGQRELYQGNLKELLPLVDEPEG